MNTMEGYATQVSEQILGHRMMLMCDSPEALAKSFRHVTGQECDLGMASKVVLVGVDPPRKETEAGGE